jgi:hypothetical protein
LNPGLLPTLHQSLPPATIYSKHHEMHYCTFKISSRRLGKPSCQCPES